LTLLRDRGASFLRELVGPGLDQAECLEAMGQLAAAGLVTSDGFAGLRALVRGAAGRPVGPDRVAQAAGRWSVLDASRSPIPNVRPEAAVEAQARTLLQRYGVVFRRLLCREANAAPWRDLDRVYRRLEARGEIRGGRFVSGMSGEQFA